MLRKKLIGDKKFYTMVLAVAVPIMIQNGITNFVGLMDNIMIGLIGTEPMSGVAIVNQLLGVFNLSIFGAIAGAGIFTAQFYGMKNEKGIRDTFRFKYYTCALILAVSLTVFLFFGDDLIGLWLNGEGNDEALDSALFYGKQYLAVMLVGLFPYCVEEIYTGTLRECGETVVPMRAGVMAVFVNLVLNYLLIFGKFGFPKLGVVGAAAATVISRFVQAGVVVGWTHTHTQKMPFIIGAYKSFRVPARLALRIAQKGAPLMANEFLWSAGMAALTQCYSLRGLDAVAAVNIAMVIVNVFNVVFIALGNSIGIIVGQILGSGDLEKARDTDTKLIAFSTGSCFVVGAVLALVGPFFPNIYNTSAEIRALAATLIRIAAVCMPISGFMHACYFTLRCGGRTVITFLFDGAFIAFVSFPFAFLLSRLTALPLPLLFLSVQLTDLIKCAIGFILVKNGLWIQNIVAGYD